MVPTNSNSIELAVSELMYKNWFIYANFCFDRTNLPSGKWEISLENEVGSITCRQYNLFFWNFHDLLLMVHAIMTFVYQIQYDIIIKILQETIKAY